MRLRHIPSLPKWRLRAVHGDCEDSSPWKEVGVALGLVIAWSGLYYWSKHRAPITETYASTEDFRAQCHLKTVPLAKLKQMACAATRFNHCYDVPLLVKVVGTRRRDGQRTTLTKYATPVHMTPERFKVATERLIELRLRPGLQAGDLSPEAQDKIALQFKRWRHRLYWASRLYHTRWSMRYFLDVVGDGPRRYRSICMDNDDWETLQHRWINDIEYRLDTSQALEITVQYRPRWLSDGFMRLFE